MCQQTDAVGDSSKPRRLLARMPLAQLVEHLTGFQEVPGSDPGWCFLASTGFSIPVSDNLALPTRFSFSRHHGKPKLQTTYM